MIFFDNNCYNYFNNDYYFNHATNEAATIVMTHYHYHYHYYHSYHYYHNYHYYHCYHHFGDGASFVQNSISFFFANIDVFRIVIFFLNFRLPPIFSKLPFFFRILTFFRTINVSSFNSCYTVFTWCLRDCYYNYDYN